MGDSPLLCPNCRNRVEPGVSVCPNCGASMPLPPTPGQSAWPPAAVGPGNPASPTPRLLTGNAAFDFVLGVLATLLSFFIAGLGILVMPVLYFVLRPSAPVFARGIGYTLLLLGILLLGAFAFCLYGVSSSGR